ncbi:MAG TPA: thiamine-phosphate kinase [Acidimicrobiales bacterium]|nr:thiamine-phosphate kinase [Acidimicrobiales bacterium]
MASPKPRPAAGALPASEDCAIERLGQLMRSAAGRPPAGQVWIGDDAAVVPPPVGNLVLSTDAAVAGVHADLDLVGLDDLGWKALTAAVSDLGAMGAVPSWALVTLCLPPGTDLDRLGRGLADASAAWACPVVGGDLTTADQLVVSVSVVGDLVDDRPPVTRSGASAGDTVAVTGPLGASAAGLRLLRDAHAGGRDAAGPLVAAHRRPTARLAEGRAARDAAATAMMDVSDGLALDLHRLADASGVGFVLDRVPVAEGATMDEAVGGGEDYELLVVTDRPDRLDAVFAAAGLREPVRIGRCVHDPATRLLDGRPLPRLGWQHPL